MKAEDACLVVDGGSDVGGRLIFGKDLAAFGLCQQDPGGGREEIWSMPKQRVIRSLGKQSMLHSVAWRSM